MKKEKKKKKKIYRVKIINISNWLNFCLINIFIEVLIEW